MKRIILLLFCMLSAPRTHAEDGYQLWLRYNKIDDATVLQQYRNTISAVSFYGSSAVLNAAKNELIIGLRGLLEKNLNDNSIISNGSILAGAIVSAPIKAFVTDIDVKSLNKEGFLIRAIKSNHKNIIVIAANTDVGVLYGVFQFLRLLQTHQNIQHLSLLSVPKIQHRILDHWDNLNRTVERGYAGFSIWKWHELPGYIDQRYIDYARANASIGINGAVLTNVNANALVLTKNYLIKAAALANVFRAYGIKVYLTAKFSAPMEIGGLTTADPLNEAVKQWWKQKADEIYQYIPDFGGFLIKANSEGQPGPQNYGRTHADGANMLADAVAAHNGIIMWRAFVYSNETPDDRFKQAYNEFKPLDGKFRKNVLIQVKNGPIDFQPREPFHPLFGAMPQTPLMMEFQLTLEYLGQGTHLVYEAPLFKEVLDADFYGRQAITGKSPGDEPSGATVTKVIDGSINNFQLTGIAGVANIGNEINWTNHPFHQANWYAFGRLAWDHGLTSTQIAEEWIRQTFSNNQHFVDAVKKMMITSREAVVNYMTPLGLNHIMGYGHHYGPAPWYDKAPRADWNPVYFHKADSAGIGFERTVKGSNALAQYYPGVGKQFEDIKTCPDEYLLWFHHVAWNYKMRSGRTLWQELCYKYYSGVDSVRWMQHQWDKVKMYVDRQRFEQVKMFLAIQQKEAVWWRNACLLYFQTFSKLPLPDHYEKPDNTLSYYEGLQFLYVPGSN